MKKRIVGIVATCVVAIAVLGAPAVAQEGGGNGSNGSNGSGSGAPVGYFASADAKALHLSLFGNDLTLGASHADLTSAPSATGTGIGALTPLQNVSEVTGTVTENGTTAGSTTEECSPLSLPEIPVLSLETACASGFAEITDNQPSSSATARVSTIGVAPDDILFETPIPGLVGEGADAILEPLDPLLKGLDGALGGDSEGLLRDLLNGLIGEDANQLVGIELGPTSAATYVEDGAVTATSDAKGTVIEVLNRSLLELGPVLRITVGEASSTAVLDTATSEASGTFEPALVRVEVAPDIFPELPSEITGLLPFEGTELVVPVGQTVCLLPDPLESCITVANGSVTTNEDGSTTVATSAVRLDLLKGIEGGISLALADTTATVGTIAAEVPAPPATPPAPAPPVTPPSQLPRTGPSGLLADTTALFAVAGIAGLGLIVAARARRRV